MIIDYAKLQIIASEHLYPLVFATISGAHLFGKSDGQIELAGKAKRQSRFK
jgi:hypothetical protein